MSGFTLTEWARAHQRLFGELDGRLSRWKKGEVRGSYGPLPSMLFEPCFCLHCGESGGYVTKDTPIIYVCEQCAADHPPLPLPKVPAILEQDFRL